MLMYWFFGAVCLFCCAISVAEESDATAADLIQMDFEELVNMDIEISSAGKLKSRVKDLPYPAYVLSAKDIEQAGAQNIPEALRLIPGVFIGQISANEWFLAIRGSGGRYSRFVLIMVDGRIAYNNLYSGVNWDEMNFHMDSIERIEVVRGPNGATWGPNSVNGIIHIITKKRSSNKSSVTALVGSEGHQGLSAQWYSSLGDNWSLLLSGQARAWDGLIDEVGQREESIDNWRTQLSLSRRLQSSETRFTFDAFGSHMSPEYRWILLEPLGETSAPLDDEKKGFVFVGEHSSSLNQYYEYTIRGAIDSIDSDSLLYNWQETNQQADFELVGDLSRHSLSLGLNWRRSDTTLLYKEALQVPGMIDRVIDRVGVYVSDQIMLGKQWSAILSMRWDDHELADPVTQPSLRLIWQPSDTTSLWLAGSKAVAAPAGTIIEIPDIPFYLEESQAPFPPILLRFGGYAGSDKATEIIASELGWRNAFEKFNIDISLFRQDYLNNLSVDEIETTFVTEQGVPLYLDNKMILGNDAEYSAVGGELSFRFQWWKRWSSQLNFSQFYLSYELDEPQKDWSMMASLQNSIQLSNDWYLNVIFRRAKGGFTTPRLDSELLESDRDSYTIADINLAWTLNEQWRVALMAKNVGKKHNQADREQFKSSVPSLVAPYGMVKLEYKLK